MNLILRRNTFVSSGIFGELAPEDSSFNLMTLEHAYLVGETSEPIYGPKIPPGTYVCKRGMHILDGMTAPFETFQITNVPGHSNILFHTGNTNADSSGCVLVGLFRSANDSIMQSRAAFNILMQSQLEIDEFTLTIF